MAADARPEPIDSDWLDAMVNKLKAELEAQLAQAAGNPRKTNSAASRAADARTLASLERTLERLAQLEQARAAVRETKVSKEGARDALERRLDKLAGTGEETPGS